MTGSSIRETRFLDCIRHAGPFCLPHAPHFRPIIAPPERLSTKASCIGGSPSWSKIRWAFTPRRSPEESHFTHSLSWRESGPVRYARPP